MCGLSVFLFSQDNKCVKVFWKSVWVSKKSICGCCAVATWYCLYWNFYMYISLTKAHVRTSIKECTSNSTGWNVPPSSPTSRKSPLRPLCWSSIMTISLWFCTHLRLVGKCISGKMKRRDCHNILLEIAIRLKCACSRSMIVYSGLWTRRIMCRNRRSRYGQTL